MTEQAKEPEVDLSPVVGEVAVQVEQAVKRDGRSVMFVGYAGGTYDDPERGVSGSVSYGDGVAVDVAWKDGRRESYRLSASAVVEAVLRFAVDEKRGEVTPR